MYLRAISWAGYKALWPKVTAGKLGCAYSDPDCACFCERELGHPGMHIAYKTSFSAICEWYDGDSGAAIVTSMDPNGNLVRPLGSANAIEEAQAQAVQALNNAPGLYPTPQPVSAPVVFLEAERKSIAKKSRAPFYGSGIEDYDLLPDASIEDYQNLPTIDQLK